MTLQQVFTKHCNKPDIKRWVVALSGGLDSMVVLDLAAQLSSLPFNSSSAPADVVAFHVNHQQQSQAAEWQAFCESQCKLRNIAFFSCTVSPDGGSEAQLREARYAAFTDFLQAGDCLLLGHHADDQAETVLFRLTRAAGAKGLSGMPEHRALGSAFLLRPLLCSSRDVLQQYATSHQLDWIEDPSNDRLIYDRNYLRHQVLKPLKQHWPKVSEQIAVSAQLLRDDQALLQSYLNTDLERIADNNQLDLCKLSIYDEVKSNALIKQWVQNYTDMTVSRSLLTRVVNDVIKSEDGSVGNCVIGEYIIRRYQQSLYITKEVISDPEWPNILLAPLEVTLEAGVLVVSASTVGIALDDSMYLATYQASMKMIVRNRGAKKLKKLFQEKRIPPWQRESWPVLMQGANVVCLPGICSSDDILNQDEKKSLFSLEWQPL